MVVSLFQVLTQMKFGSCVEVGNALFVSFALDNTFPFVEVDIVPVQLHQFTYPHTGGGK